MRTTALLRSPLLAVVLVAAACSPDGEGGPAADVTAFQGARLITGAGGDPIEDGVLLVRDGRIEAVGARGEVDVPGGATVVDLAGRTVMPALVNTHMHLASEREARAEELRHNAYYGATVVTSLGLDSGDVALAMRDEARPAGAARALSAGRGITRPEPGRSQVPYWVDGEEEARQAVRELAERNVDLVKIWVDDRGGRYEKMTPALYGAVIDEAHDHDLKVAAHIFTLEDAKGLLAAGVDAFAHGVRDMDVDDAFVEALAGSDTYYIPNLPDPGVARDMGWLAGTVPADELADIQAGAVDRPDAREAYAIQARNLARVDRAGARIAFGTDGGSPWAAHTEMEDMVRAGMSPADVIVAATRTSAELLGLDDVGTLEAGKSADFVVLEANPLDDITNTRRIADVYLRGMAMDRQAVSAGATGGA